MKFSTALLALLCLALSAFAEVKQITVTGAFDQASPEAMAHFGISDLPIPFTYTLQYDDAVTLDWADLNPAIGVYYFDTLPVTIDFAGTRIESWGAEIRVYNGEGGFRGVTFGNRNPFQSHGIDFPEYVAPYGSFINPFASAITSDSLAWVDAGVVNGTSSYVEIIGETVDGGVIHFQQNALPAFSVASVPEPSPFILAALSLGLFMTVSRPRRF